MNDVVDSIVEERLRKKKKKTINARGITPRRRGRLIARCDTWNTAGESRVGVGVGNVTNPCYSEPTVSSTKIID
jgi:hypothetical protein